MSTPKSNKPEGLLGLSTAEARMILLGVLSSDESGKVDFDKMAVLGGYKNAPSASTLYRGAKRKLLGGQNGTTSTPSKGPAATPKKTPAKGKKGKAAGEEEDGDGAVDSPLPPKAKRQKTTDTPKTPHVSKKVVKIEGNSTLEPSIPVPKKAAVKNEANSKVKEEMKEDSSDTDAYYDALVKKEDDRSDTEELMDSSQLTETKADSKK
ncbi:putative histone h1.3 [Aspergillus ibericus CBS 121593]|uniref:Histone h1.3 n=1 Tax=Aspergillus ibericus CBS 121593 TaxID=1448316 RepID=A0A395HD94_9EURO|nr:hypothetical protein BO80DRAFT_440688 [Aspergillus ibericus CBS 121593]RAL05951.1 hypothetical protein BO80DRAFT_440688 [Aspergillus ibericus CBS 121593]